MGFDLVAKRPRDRRAGYYRANIPFMGVLRSAMVAAGVSEQLVYKKFVSNDDLFVTAREAAAIAERLTNWLHGRKLILDIAEHDPGAHIALDGLVFVARSVGKRKQAETLTRLGNARTALVRVDRKLRRLIRGFAAFCASSGGFHVD